MFQQKEMSQRILGSFETKLLRQIIYPILTNFRLHIVKNLMFPPPNCFFPQKPKVASTICIAMEPKKKFIKHSKNKINLEKITNVLFSNKRKTDQQKY